MGSIKAMLEALNESAIAENVYKEHDNARVRYPLHSNTVQNFDEFIRIISDYYAYHHNQCVAPGGQLSPTSASGKVKRLVEGQYQRQNKDIVSAYHDAREGTNGGLRHILDVIADMLKMEAVEDYVTEVFDQNVSPASFGEKVEIIRQFIASCGAYLSPETRNAPPEQFAHDYKVLIREYINALRDSSSRFRDRAGR